MASPTGYQSIFIDTATLKAGDVIEFIDREMFPKDDGGYFKIVAAWDSKKDENGQTLQDDYLGCDRLYNLVHLKTNESYIYKISDRAPDTLKKTWSRISPYKLPITSYVRIISHGTGKMISRPEKESRRF
jgi:hypothetical protein